MIPNKLKKYVKEGGELDTPVSTSVTLEKRHTDFIKANNLNLSRMVRDFLDQLFGAKGAEGNSNDNQE